MRRPTRSEDELKTASNHLYYEILMLQMTMSGLFVHGSDSVLNRFILPSFGIHARLLMHFLYPDRSKRSDVLAEDFVCDWSNIRPPAPKLPRDARYRVSKEIAHLTYVGKHAPKSWDIWNIGNPILRVIQKFLDVVPSNLLGDRWPNDGEARRSVAKTVVAGEAYPGWLERQSTAAKEFYKERSGS